MLNPNQVLSACDALATYKVFKSKKLTAASIFFEYHDYFIHSSKHGNKDIFYKLIGFASTKDPLFYSYVALFSNVSFYYKDEELKISTKGKCEDDVLKSCIIDFESYIALSEKKRPTIEQIDNIRKDILRYHSSWKKELRRLIKWPSSEAPKSFRELKSTEWVVSGVLSKFGYQVGLKGHSKEKRQQILDHIISCDISDEGVKNVEDWHQPDTMGRLIKTARVLASLCRNAKRREDNFELAIQHWESDLIYLKEKYFDYSDQRIDNSWKDRKIETVRSIYS